MDTALINLSKWKKLRGYGYGRLTKEKAIKFEYYYRGAFKSNCMSTDESPQHDQCMVVAGKLLKHYKLTLKEPAVNVEQHDEDISEHPLDNLDDLLNIDIEDRSLGYDTESYVEVLDKTLKVM